MLTDKNKFHYTYKITHPNGKYYLGRRSNKNVPHLDNYWGSGTWVKSIKDKSILTKEIVEIFDNFDDLCIGEVKLITEHWDDENCMNYSKLSCGLPTEHNLNVGRKHSEETKKKQSKARLGRFVRENSHNWGKTRSEETKKKCSDAKIGKKNTEEHKHNISKVRTGKYAGECNQFFGKKHSEESRAKMSDSHKGVINSTETKYKKSIATKGENNPNCTITESIATEIKIRLANGESIVKLKNEYGTTRDVIANIKYEKSWKHIKI